jgi:hypothetical protein
MLDYVYNDPLDWMQMFVPEKLTEFLSEKPALPHVWREKVTIMIRGL